MEATWHHLGAIDLGAELSVIDLDTEVLTCVFWHLKITSTVLVEIQIVCSSLDGEDASILEHPGSSSQLAIDACIFLKNLVQNVTNAIF